MWTKCPHARGHPRQHLLTLTYSLQQCQWERTSRPGAEPRNWFGPNRWSLSQFFNFFNSFTLPKFRNNRHVNMNTKCFTAKWQRLVSRTHHYNQIYAIHAGLCRTQPKLVVQDAEVARYDLILENSTRRDVNALTMVGYDDDCSLHSHPYHHTIQYSVFNVQ